MNLSDILVQIDANPANAIRLELAAKMASRHGAHLTGLCVFDFRRAPAARYGAIGVEDSLALLQYQAQLHDEARAVAAELEIKFRERLRRDGIQGEWRMVEGDAAATIGLHARYADLAILGQEDPNSSRVYGWNAVIEAALFTSGRPILIVPYAGQFSEIGRRVLIGWNARREAARAVHDALPLLDKARSVTVLAIDPRRGVNGHGDEPAADLSRHLARHGLPVTAEQTSSGGLDPADVLLNYAADRSIDLVVIGGYGHARFQEILLGGVTRDLLHRMTVPVLMSH